MAPCLFGQKKNGLNFRNPGVNYFSAIQKLYYIQTKNSVMLNCTKSLSQENFSIPRELVVLLSENIRLNLIPHFDQIGILNVPILPPNSSHNLRQTKIQIYPDIRRILICLKQYLMSLCLNLRMIKCFPYTGTDRSGDLKIIQASSTERKSIMLRGEQNEIEGAVVHLNFSQVNLRGKCNKNSLENSARCDVSQPEILTTQDVLESCATMSDSQCMLMSKKKSDIVDLNTQLMNIKKKEVTRRSKKRSKRMRRKEKSVLGISEQCNVLKSAVTPCLRENVHVRNFQLIDENQPHTEENDSEVCEYPVLFDDEMDKIKYVFSDESDECDFCGIENVHSSDSSFSDPRDSDDSDFSNITLDSLLTNPTDSEDSDFSIVFDDNVSALNSSFVELADGSDVSDSSDQFEDNTHILFCDAKNTGYCAHKEGLGNMQSQSGEILVVQKPESDVCSNTPRISNAKYFKFCDSKLDSESDSDLDCDNFIVTNDFIPHGSLVMTVHKTKGNFSGNHRNGNMQKEFSANLSKNQMPLKYKGNISLTTVNQIGMQAATSGSLKIKKSMKVTFAPENELVSIFPVEAFDRKGEWEQFALDRIRFKRRISEVGKILSSCLSPVHRANICKKLSDFSS